MRSLLKTQKLPHSPYIPSQSRLVQRRENHRVQSSDAPPVIHEALNLPNQSSDWLNQSGVGLPDGLQTGIENLSGVSMEDVKVHYHSSKPARLQAAAFTQGRNIYVGPRQEKHLPHEAWHVVQQKQGRVKPTVKARSIELNNDESLEKEADLMGQTAKQLGNGILQGEAVNSSKLIGEESSLRSSSFQRSPETCIQRQILDPEYEEDVFDLAEGKRQAELADMRQGRIAAADPRRAALGGVLGAKGNRSYRVAVPSVANHPPANLPSIVPANPQVFYVGNTGIAYNQPAPAVPAPVPAVGPVAPAPAVGPAAPAPVAPVVQARTSFLNATPNSLILLGGKRWTLAGTPWFMVGWGPRQYSLHVHVKSNGAIDSKENKIRSRDMRELIYVDNIPTALNAKIRSLNPFRS